MDGHCLDRLPDRGLRLTRQCSKNTLTMAVNRLDRLRLVDRITDEQGVDQILGRDLRFARQPAERRPGPQAAGTFVRKAHAEIGARLRTMASTSPRVVYSCAMISTRSPRSRAVCAVIGPMQATVTRSAGRPSIALAKWRTVDELVNVITSTPGRQAASRARRSGGGTAR